MYFENQFVIVTYFCELFWPLLLVVWMFLTAVMSLYLNTLQSYAEYEANVETGWDAL